MCVQLRFYRAMLCIARTMLSQDVHLSVCLSVRPCVTRQYCVEIAKYIIKLFPTEYEITSFDGDSPNGGVECRGIQKSRFSTNISLYLEDDTR